MALLDEEGNLFGVVNAVDALAVVFVGLLVVGGVAVAGAGPGEPSTDGLLVKQVVVEGTVSPSVAAAIDAGPVPTPGIVLVDDVSTSESDGNVTVRATVRLRVDQTDDGLTVYNGTRLYIGRELTLDLGEATLDGVVVEAFEPFRMAATPTATPTPTATTSPTPTPTPTPKASPTRSPTSTATPSPTPTPTSVPTPTASPGPTSPTTHVVTFVATVSEERADRIETGSVGTAEIVAVTRKVSRPIDGDVRVEIAVELQVERAVEGAVFFRGVELVEGQRVVLDLGAVEVIGRVTGL